MTTGIYPVKKKFISFKICFKYFKFIEIYFKYILNVNLNTTYINNDKTF